MSQLLLEQCGFIKIEPKDKNDSDSETVVCARDILFEATAEPAFKIIKSENELADLVKEEIFDSDECHLFPELNDTKLKNDYQYAMKVSGKVYYLKKGKVLLERLSACLDLKGNEKFKSHVSNFKKITKSKPGKLFISNVHMTFENSFNHYCLKCNEKTKFNFSIRDLKKCLKCNEKLRSQCRKCNTIFDVNQNLKRHYLFCGKEPDLQCHICSYKTRHKRNLDRHVKNHDINKLKISDKKSLPSGHFFSYFKRHCPKCDKIIENNGLKCSRFCQICSSDLNFICLRCNTKTESYRKMYWHLKTKCLAKEKTTSCTKCGKILKRSLVYVQKHIRYCTKRLEFTCDYCQLKTKYKYTLQLHITNKHCKPN